LERLVVALLAKDPDDRIQTAHDAKLQLGWLLDAGVSTPSSAVAASVPAGRRPRRVSPAWVIAGLAAVVAIAAWLPNFSGGRGAGRDRARLLVPEPAGAHLDNLASSFAISPDGKTIVFVASDSSATAKLWLRPLETLTPKPIEGTEHAEQPFWSPDSRWIGFFADGKLRKVGAAGGRVETVCDAPDPRGGRRRRLFILLWRGR
ncbi:MAG TPA: hypothetical protein VFT13_06780, partial [Candidatus Krumholzibacteria bacterium]|nr:hypothetical protein [Candidatus Krumholzibacteria bacterium]